MDALERTAAERLVPKSIGNFTVFRRAKSQSPSPRALPLLNVDLTVRIPVCCRPNLLPSALEGQQLATPAATPCSCEYSVTCSQLWSTTKYDERENFFHTIPSDRGQSSLNFFETASLGPPIFTLVCGVNLYVLLMCGKMSGKIFVRAPFLEKVRPSRSVDIPRSKSLDPPLDLSGETPPRIFRQALLRPPKSHSFAEFLPVLLMFDSGKTLL